MISFTHSNALVHWVQKQQNVSHMISGVKRSFTSLINKSTSKQIVFVYFMLCYAGLSLSMIMITLVMKWVMFVEASTWGKRTLGLKCYKFLTQKTSIYYEAHVYKLLLNQAAQIRWVGINIIMSIPSYGFNSFNCQVCGIAIAKWVVWPFRWPNVSRHMCVLQLKCFAFQELLTLHSPLPLHTPYYLIGSED